jgi:hypothetical protein
LVVLAVPVFKERVLTALLLLKAFLRGTSEIFRMYVFFGGNGMDEDVEDVVYSSFEEDDRRRLDDLRTEGCLFNEVKERVTILALSRSVKASTRLFEAMFGGVVAAQNTISSVSTLDDAIAIAVDTDTVLAVMTNLFTESLLLPIIDRCTVLQMAAMFRCVYSKQNS